MQARPLLNAASLWLQTSFRKQARPLLSTPSLSSLAALWRFGAVPLLEALTLLDALALLEALPLWRFVVLRRLGALRLFDASWRSGNTAAMNTGDGACVSELAALRLQRSMAVATQRRWTQEAAHESQSLRLGGFAALRLARSMAALRLCGLRVPWQLCGFAAWAFHGGFAALRLWRFSGCARVPEPACNAKTHENSMNALKNTKEISKKARVACFEGPSLCLYQQQQRQRQPQPQRQPQQHQQQQQQQQQLLLQLTTNN